MPAYSRTRGFLALLALLGGLLVAGPVATSPASAVTTTTTQATQTTYRTGLTRLQRAMQIVVNQKGDPYGYGAAGPDRFDCSGLIYYSFRRAGFTNVPRTSSAQARYARRISRSNMRRGDLVFFYSGSGVYHVGVYAGFWNGSRHIVHSSRPGTPVRTSAIWTNSWFAGTLRGK